MSKYVNMARNMREGTQNKSGAGTSSVAQPATGSRWRAAAQRLGTASESQAQGAAPAGDAPGLIEQGNTDRASSTMEVQEGAPFSDRLAAAFKFGETGEENYLKDKFGEENVFRNAKGELYYIDKKANKLVRFNPEGFDKGDLALAAPIGVGMLGGMTAAALLPTGASVPLTLGALAAGGVAGDVAKQAIGAQIPGKEEVSIPDRAGQAAISGAFEAAGPIIGKGVGTVLRAGKELVSKGVGRVAEAVASRGAASEIQAAKELEKRTGMEFSVGQRTQERAPLAVEGALRQNIASSGIVGEADARRFDALSRITDAAIAKLGTGGKEEAGRSAAAAFKAHIKALSDTRSSEAAKNFGEVSKLTGDAKVFSLKNTINAIDELSRELESDLADDAATRTASWLASKKDALLKGVPDGAGPDAVKVSSSSFRNALRIFGDRAHDPRGLIEQVTDPKIQKMVATRIFRALSQDLDEAAAGSGLSAEAAQALQKARTSYRVLSQSIEEASSNALSNFVENPEKLTDAFFSSREGIGNLHGIMRFLDETAPEVANNVRASVWREALEKSPTAGSAVEDTSFSPAKLVTTAKKYARQLDAAFSGNPEARAAFQDVVQAARRLGNTGGTGGSQTAPLNVINTAIVAAFGGSAALAYQSAKDGNKDHLMGYVGVPLATLFGTRFLARAMMEPASARSVATILKAAAEPRALSGGPAKRAVKQAFYDLATLYKREEAQADAVFDDKEKVQK